MRSTKAPGFTFVEAMVSIAIVGIISVAAYYNLRTTRMNDELRTASRVVAADLRATQARALHGSNVKWCLNTSGAWMVCEDSNAACNIPADCSAYPSGGYGVHFTKDSNVYRIYGILNNNTSDWRMSTDMKDLVMTRDLAKSGGLNVTVSDIQGAVPFTEADVAFMRQTGQMRINSCGTCAEQAFVNVTLKHALSLKTIVVSMNYYTGRISIEE